ncbi:MAG: phosphoribosylglycinamide formyltransferase [Desulfobacterales bacterium]|nr:phosphoribosylglycinamide formyltransferase [Desulfobacterales bacterium]
MKPFIRIGALISGTGTNLQAIIDSFNSGKIQGKVIFVGSDNAQAKGLTRAETIGIPTFVVDYNRIIQEYKNYSEQAQLPNDFVLEDAFAKQSIYPKSTPREKIEFFLKTRAIAECNLLKHMNSYSYDLIVLAGFMRKLSPYFIDHINSASAIPRIMNIHPALLPAFPGTDGYGDTYRYGCKIAGCTVHFVDYGEDSGPIIAQRAFPILETDTLDSVKTKGLQLEWELYAECIRLFSENRIQLVQKTHEKDRKSVIII